MWEEETPWAPPSFSTITILPLVPLRAHLLSPPSWLYFWSISLEMYAPLSAKLQVPAWSNQSCMQRKNGGRVTAEQGGAMRATGPEPGGLELGRAKLMQRGATVMSQLHCSYLWRLPTAQSIFHCTS